ncbi:MAG: hypothetical protein JSR67_13135 [Proteobacteria bacterium]|nr:hypothetical protein [Pseudomonadota bacterium]
MNRISILVGGALALAAAALVSADEPTRAPAMHKMESAGDPVRVSTATHKVVFEDASMRVLDIHLAAAGHANMHRHPHGFYLVALSDCKLKFSFPDGTTREGTIHAGDMGWYGPVTHAADNLGSNECHVVNIEPRLAHRATQAEEKPADKK